MDSAILKVKTTLKRRRMTLKQLFSQRAGKGGVHLSTSELVACLQQLGVDEIEAGRLVLAAVKMDFSGDLLNLCSEPTSVSLSGFQKLMGSLGNPEPSSDEDEAAVSEMPASPETCIAETALALDQGRWSVRVVAHQKFSPVWSSAQVPGHEGRPFGIWRLDLRSLAAGNFQQNLRTLVGVKSGVRHFLLGDIGVRGLGPPSSGLVLQLKASKNPPKGRGAGHSLDGWIARYLPRPIAYRLIWHDRRGVADQGGAGGEGLYVWRPVPPSEFFIAVGAVCTTDSAEPRGVDIRCVPKTWLVRGDTLGPATWSLGERQEIRVQEGLRDVIACPTEQLRYYPSWAFISDRFFAGT